MASAINQLIAQGGGEDVGGSILKALYMGQQIASARRQGELQGYTLQKAMREDEQAKSQLAALARLADHYDGAGQPEMAATLRAGGQGVLAKLVDRQMDPFSGTKEIDGILFRMKDGQLQPIGGNVPMLNGQPIGGVPSLTSGGRAPMPSMGGGYAGTLAKYESGGDPNARNPNSTAVGPHQFLEGTWLEQIQKHAPGIVESVAGPGANLNDPNVRAQILELRTDEDVSRAVAEGYAKENANHLAKFGIDPTPANLMISHFLGGAGAARFLKADPNAPGVSVVSPEAVQANRNVFFGKDGRPRTVGELRQMVDQRMAGVEMPGGPAQGGQSGLAQGAPAAPQMGAPQAPQSDVTPLTDPVGRPYTKGAPQGMQWGRNAQGQQVLMQIPGGAPPTNDMREYELAKQQGFQGTLLDYQTALKQAGRSQTNIDMKSEGEEAKTVGKFYGEQFADIQKAGLSAQQGLNNLDRLSNLLESVNTGKAAGTTLEIKRMAKNLGVDLEKYGIRDDVAPAEAAQALSREITLQLRNPSGGAGMPGAMSDSDREFLASMVPGIETTPEGRRLMMETTRRVNQRSIEVARMAREYRAKNGRLDEGFFDQLQQHSTANPLFRDLVQDMPDPSKWQAVPIPNDLKPGGQGQATQNNPYSGMTDEQMRNELKTRGLLK